MKAQWAARIIAILMLIGFIALMVHLQHQLEGMRAERAAAPPPPAATDTTTNTAATTDTSSTR